MRNATQETALAPSVGGPASPGAPPAQSIPLLVDAVRDVDGIAMARCAFLIVGIDDPVEGLTVARASLTVPVLVLGLVGIVHRPPGDPPRFRSADDVDAAIRLIEDTTGTSVEMDDVWLPAWLLESRVPNGRIERGDVFRIGMELFSAAYRFREQRLSPDDLLRVAEETAQTVEPSGDETAAFDAWNRRQVDSAREHYRANEALALGWTDEGSSKA